ncbi:hypothetical protein HMPREF0973_00506 [Prevotella veroralis F0319]|uniref:Uncharacterized protein n=1 Tax=Prevotella veroralis F0319 TaxID=649761 RepID=C9MLN1_9BACT|nr:hypothetical protein HMPREF0973_00506 [Prevotella veroralis F0319]
MESDNVPIPYLIGVAVESTQPPQKERAVNVSRRSFYINVSSTNSE